MQGAPEVGLPLLRSDGADDLTGLPNRAAFDRAVERALASAGRTGQSLGLGIMDLDQFRKLNAELGYLGANQVLTAVAGRIRSGVRRRTDVVARWGGDEFIALIQYLDARLAAGRKGARETLERARCEVRAAPVETLCGPRIVTLSAGLALYPHEGTGRKDLFDLANARLKIAKEAGGDRVVCGDEDLPDGASPSLP